MKAQIISDIHLEFGERNFDFSDVDLLIIAGDLHIGTKGIEWIKAQNSNIPVVYILGNHEYYKNTYPKLVGKIKDLCAGTNIYVLEKESVIIKGITFHGATLWTDFKLFGNPKIAGFECQQRMNDYRFIRRLPGYSKFRSIDTHLIHVETLKWLKHSLLSSSTKTNIVVSHHAPDIQSIPSEFKGDLISAGYASNLEEFIKETNPDFWFHGHVHTSSDYFVKNTRVICNPAGYPGEPNNDYNEKLILKIE